MVGPLDEVRLEIPPRLDYLAVVRMVVASVAALDPLLPESRLDDLRLAVTEATSNAVKSHRATGDRSPVAISCQLHEDRLQVEIADRGPGFDPERHTAVPDPTDPQRLHHESGLGLPLIRVLTDGVSFASTGSGTVVTMVLHHLPAH